MHSNWIFTVFSFKWSAGELIEISDGESMAHTLQIARCTPISINKMYAEFPEGNLVNSNQDVHTPTHRQTNSWKKMRYRKRRSKIKSQLEKKEEENEKESQHKRCSPPSSRAICTWLVTIRSLLFYPPCEKRHFLILCSNAKSRRFSIRPIWQRPFLSDWCINGNNYCFKHPTPSPTFALHRPPFKLAPAGHVFN